MEEHQKKRPLLVNQVTGELYKSASPDEIRREIVRSRQGLMQLTRYLVTSPLDAEVIFCAEKHSKKFDV